MISKQLAPHRITNEMMVFATVAKLGSFTEAAKCLNLGRPRISQIINQLESRLAVTLINRTTRSLSLTEVGSEYYDKCKLIFELSEEANATTQQSRDTVGGVLRIKVPVGGAFLTQLVSSFLCEYPEIRIELIESDTPVDLVKNRIDVAFVGGPLEDSSLRGVPLGSINEILSASTDYLSRHGTPKTPGDLLRFDWISHVEQQRRDKMTIRRSGHSDIKLRQTAKVVAGSAASLKEFVIAGAGFGILPTTYIAEELKSGKLVRILPNYHGYKIPITAVFAYQETVPLKVRAFLDFVKANLRIPVE